MFSDISTGLITFLSLTADLFFEMTRGLSEVPKLLRLPFVSGAFLSIMDYCYILMQDQLTSFLFCIFQLFLTLFLSTNQI